MKKLTIEDVKKRINKIKDLDGDDEVQHVYEDDLFYDFVESIKNGDYLSKKQIEEVADELFKVREINFSRWHA